MNRFLYVTWVSSGTRRKEKGTLISDPSSNWGASTQVLFLNHLFEGTRPKGE